MCPSGCDLKKSHLVALWVGGLNVQVEAGLFRVPLIHAPASTHGRIFSNNKSKCACLDRLSISGNTLIPSSQ